MAAIYQRRKKWWVRFYHPLTGALVRESLGTHDAAKAELLRQRVELETALLEPRFRAADLPENVYTALGLSCPAAGSSTAAVPKEAVHVEMVKSPAPLEKQRLRPFFLLVDVADLYGRAVYPALRFKHRLHTLARQNAGFAI